jgi:two-component system cell cycle sensor histidine kinase/response regulator CckA
VKHEEDTLGDRFAEQIEALRARWGQLARRVDGGAASPKVPREPREELESAVELLRLAEEELRRQHEQLLAAQQALDLERRRYLELFELAPCGFIVTDTLGVIQEMNRTAELLLNQPREQLRCKPLIVLLPKEARPSFLSHLQELLRRGAGEVEAWETLLVAEGAAPFPAELAASPVLDGDGRLAALRWLVRDLRDRRQVERALETERELMDVFLRDTADGLVVVDRTGTVVLVNEVARTILGVGAVIPGRRLHHTLVCAGRSAALSPVNGAEGVAYEVTLDAPRPRAFDLRINPLDNEGHVLLLREVTAGRAARESAERQARLAATGQLAAGIAHDFNNILSVVLSHAGLLRNDPRLPEDVQLKLRAIADQARRGGRLVRHVLDFARRAPTRRQQIDLAACVRRIVHLLEQTFPENIVIRSALATGECVAEADPVQVEQVVANLALNARDAMRGGGRLRIGLSRRALKEGEAPPVAGMSPGEWAALSVTDTGSGMSPAVRRHLFAPFFSTKGGRGTGLGLAQVYDIVQQHRGYVDVTSEVGRGTTFTVYLRLAAADGRPQARMRREPKAGDVEDDGSPTLPTGWGEVILLVEDDAAARAASAEALQSLGYRVLAAESAEQAWDLWERHRDEIALVLTDLVMPGVGGAHLSSALARQGRAPVIVLSGYPIDGEDGRLAGAAHLLQKPIAIERLARVVHDTLAAARR